MNIDNINITHALGRLDSVSDRTLLYGITYESNFHHVYLKDSRVFLHVFNNENDRVEFVMVDEMTELCSLIPKDHVIASRSCPDFCKVMKNIGYDMVFDDDCAMRISIGFVVPPYSG